MKHHRTKPVEIGGLFRCCLLCLDSSEVEEVAGEVISCEFCGASMIFDGQTWKMYDPIQEDSNVNSGSGNV